MLLAKSKLFIGYVGTTNMQTSCVGEMWKHFNFYADGRPTCGFHTAATSQTTDS